jgi:hypothetical protein
MAPEYLKTFPDWKHEVDQRMHFTYAITIVDAGFDDEELQKHWDTRLPACEFVEWIARKHDLTSVAEWNGSVLSMR